MSVALDDVRKRFGPAGGAAVDGVTLAAEDGGFLAVLGPSGSGKTTLLRLIAGLEFPDAGRILIDGRDMAGVPARARGAGMVFQSYALFRHMNVADNIAFGLRIRPRATRPDRAAIAARVAELLDLVQMPDFARRFPDQLSGGQRQRVALARALAIEPRLLLLDEPFGALDTHIRKELRRWLRALHVRLGLTTVLVTHDLTEAMELADRVAVLRAGRLEQVDTPAGLHAAPATAFVHAFLGDSVSLPCLVQQGQAVFDPAWKLHPLPTPLPDGPAQALIRPEQILLGPSGRLGAAARVIALHAIGSAVRVELALGSQRLDALVPQGRWLPREGDTCTLGLGGACVYSA